MKQYIRCVLLGTLILLLCVGCGQPVPQDSPWPLKEAEQSVPAENKGVSVSLDWLDGSEHTAVFLFRNESDKVLYCGTDYALQVKRDGLWYEIDLYADHTAEEILLEPGEVWPFQIWWSVPYGQLPAGEYRLVKSLWSSSAMPKLTGWALGCEFTIE